ncbi:hypothetical protein JYQ62_19635 [Nostoc sp. UHCC 0702]|nr:hypothetical protein JYQ62_19635 [Nostoc sp. UHCC 0702]
MTEKFTPYLVNQRAALDAVKQVEHLSDDELKQIVLKMLKKFAYPSDDLNLAVTQGLDITREGLLDFIAGNAAIAKATPVEE